jgi:hypothetical protein
MTSAETRDKYTTMIDERFGFGALGANELAQGGISLAYCFPGSENSRRRYHGFCINTCGGAGQG